MKTKNRTKQNAALIGAFLLILCAASLWYLFSHAAPVSGCIAEIYQEGILLTSIPLEEVQEPYTFIVTGEQGGENRVEVRPGSIGVVWADCPDRLCVSQGFIDDAGLPIVCLPNRLVIRLRPAAEPDAVDAAAY